MNKAIYNPKEIEPKWSSVWEEEGTYRTPKRDNSKQKAYVLGMFPYPSGDGLHTGHGRIFTAVDVVSRYLRMKGFQVLAPMGWDAFGLPAENAAIKAKKNPKDMVGKNEANFKRQMNMLGFGLDWEREFSTADPTYYRWTQWLFLKLYQKKNNKGERLLYRKEVPINWCPKCKTGIANEEVLADNTHERCGTSVEQRLLPQWVMRITDYAQPLLDDLEGLDWPEGILAMQRNWIGKKEGYEVDFGDGIKVFTTRLDTICGTTFVVVSPEMVKTWLDGGWKTDVKVITYVENALKKQEQQRLEEVKEKTGVKTDRVVINPVTGEKVPVFVGDYVLGNVGTGAVMGVPAHDERDFEFAKKHGLDIRFVVSEEADKATIDDGVLVNSGKYDGLTSKEAREKIAGDLGTHATKKITWHLRDWVFSRQRYWGEPFPLVYCDKCGDENGVVPLSEDQLPLELPLMESYEPTDDGKSPLSRNNEWKETTCPICGGKATRETDTMPNWAGSCWYFLRFVDSKNHDQAWSNKELADWAPVDWYLGGAEHAVLHLLYARFWVKVFKDLGLLNFSEPFLRLRSVGMVLASDGRKMSKSLGNVVNPDDVVDQYGADAVRIYEMFMGPWDQAIAWDPRSLVGCYRLIEKLYKLIYRNKDGGVSSARTKQALYESVLKVGTDIEALKFNTAVATLMKFVNLMGESETLDLADLKILVKTIAPLAPFVAEELWQILGEKRSVHLQEWPTNLHFDIDNHTRTIICQVNGKVRGTMEMSLKDASDQALVEEKAKTVAKVASFLQNGQFKTIFVSGRLVNFVSEV